MTVLSSEAHFCEVSDSVSEPRVNSFQADDLLCCGELYCPGAVTGLITISLLHQYMWDTTDKLVPDIAVIKSPPPQSLDYFANLAGQISDEPIGTGGQTAVYEATLPDAESPNRVAVRQLGQPGFPQAVSREDKIRFDEQIQKWETLACRERIDPQWSDSDCIVGVIDTGERLPWVALEYMDGGSLADRLAANPTGLPMQEALWIGEHLCQGLELAHTNSIEHLDLSPSNILFRQTPDNTWDVPKIANWGLARNLLEDASESMDVLSMNYGAPEQFEPETFGRLGTVTDIYQLGAVMYALLTGKPPYSGTDQSMMFDITSEDLPLPPSDIAGERVSEGLPSPPTDIEGFPSPSDLDIDIFEQIDAAVLYALEPQKSDRYDAIGIFKQALRAIRTGTPLPPSVNQRLDSTEAQVEPVAFESDVDKEMREELKHLAKVGESELKNIDH